MLSETDDSAEASAVEDSLRGSIAHGRTNPIPTDLFSRPLPAHSNDAYAFAATPDSAPPHPATLQAGWHSPRVAGRSGHPAGAAAAAAFDETPGAGPSTAAAFHAPPRIERQLPAARTNTHIAIPILPSFAAGAGPNLFARPPTASTAATGVNAFGSPTEMSMSSSFSFAPRAATGSLFGPPSITSRDAVPVAAAAYPQFAAPHTPFRSARPTTAAAAAAAHHAMATSPSSAASSNLDATALAAERRIREARAASRSAASGEEAHRQRRVSFSPTISTPQNNGGADILHHAVAAAPPSLPNRAAAAAGAAPPRQASIGVDSSLSLLGNPSRYASIQHQSGGAEYPDASFSLSTDSTFARPTATRLFAASSTTAEPQPLSSSSSTARSTHAAAKASEPEPEADSGAHSVSWSAENASSSIRSASFADPPPPTVRLRKWDGSQAVVPAYLLSDSAETVVEEQRFDHDVQERFDMRSIVARRADNVAGRAALSTEKAGAEGEAEDVDAVQAILEIQLGLRGLHGWYGHTFRNRPGSSTKDDGRTSRKRRRSDASSTSASVSDTPAEEDDDPIIVYDAFGRIRGHITLPNYTAHGGPPLPLPSPHQTFALRHESAASHVLHTTAQLVAKEQTLVDNLQQLKDQCASLQSTSSTTVRSERFMSELKSKRKALVEFQRHHRAKLRKGLQNAYVDSVTLSRAPRRI
ncbi:hypothetical protein EX895_005206 [Sporisorium graminicola]|uniref:Uncharacterized protein n=1 Tax=Sporisorium graminicola TaxID=280036 RepID=A0A4U7KP02_9BASI|nr:hypothetical protein EX895_005206 [Sporisorium graminicola]TKY85666.1 hypothetical protein EX895_005206 [Sporisorium graminicola]